MGESEAPDTACANCGATLAGPFCGLCGQRRFVERDRRFVHLVGQFAKAATDLDGRFWRSLRALMLQPGRIAADYMRGRRAYWMSPLSLFLFANVLFFFAPGVSDLTLELDQQVPEPVLREFRSAEQNAMRQVHGMQMHNALTAPLARAALSQAREQAKREGRAFDLERYAIEYHARSDAIGKLLVIVHVPCIALVLQLLAWRSRRYFAEHFVLALTMMAFTMLFVQAVVVPAAWAYLHARVALGLAPGGMPTLVRLALVLVNIVFFSIACRRCYGSARWLAIMQGIGAFAALAFGNLFVYRGLQLLITLWAT